MNDIDDDIMFSPSNDWRRGFQAGRSAGLSEAKRAIEIFYRSITISLVARRKVLREAIEYVNSATAEKGGDGN